MCVDNVPQQNYETQWDKKILLKNCPKKEHDFNNLASALKGGAIKVG